MRILILGAGRVGESVAESLVSEKNDITVIDSRNAAVAVTGSAGRTHADNRHAVIGHSDQPDLNGGETRHCGHTLPSSTSAPHQ
jgi:Trk K+ transport system NAD-binding subunit